MFGRLAEPIVPGVDAQQSLVKFTWEDAAIRHPEGVPDTARKSSQHELDLIRTLNYAPYFLTVLSNRYEATTNRAV